MYNIRKFKSGDCASIPTYKFPSRVLRITFSIEFEAVDANLRLIKQSFLL
jgi:hypothetical protein